MILVAMIVLAVAGYIILDNKPVQSPTLPQSTASSTVLVTNLAPAVFIKSDSDSQKHEVATTSTATPGSTVSTGEAGRALIEEASKKIVLDFDTELVLSSNMNGEEHNILKAGSVWSRVEKVFEKGQFYEIETKNAVAAVRGTSFGVTYKDETTFLIVVEGAVWFAPIDANGQADETKAVIVKAGEKAQIKDGKVSVFAISSSDKKDSWYVFVNELLSPMTSQATLHATSTVSTTKILNTTNTSPKPSTTSNSNGGSPSSSGGGTVATQESLQNSNISIREISPKAMQQGATDNPITLTGVGFKDVTTILLNKTPIQYFYVYSDTQIDFGINLETQAGTYDVTVITSANTQDTLSGGLTVTPMESRFLQNNAQ